MRIGRKLHFDGNKMIVQETHDVEPVMDTIPLLREKMAMGHRPLQSGVLAARVPVIVLQIWSQLSGVRQDDPAFADVIERKLNDSEFSKFRVYEGAI